MAVPVTQIRRNNVIKIDGVNFKVLDHHLNTPGNKGGIVTFKLKNMDSGANVSKRFNSNQSVETAYLSKRECQYLYAEGESFVFMDNETYDQLEVAADTFPEDQSKWVKENQEVVVLLFNGNPLGVELPASVELEITETTPQAKGTTATNQLKEATVETGARVRVPPFIEIGQVVRINPATGEYLGKG